MLAMLDQPRLRLTVQGLGLPDGETRFANQVFGVEADRRGPYELAIQLYAPLPGDASAADVRDWIGALRAAVNVTLSELTNVAEPRQLVWLATDRPALDALVQAWLLSDVAVPSGGAVTLRRSEGPTLCTVAEPGHPFAARFVLHRGELTVGVMPVQAGHDDGPRDPQDAEWLAAQIAAAGARATRDPLAPSIWTLASPADHDRLYRFLTRAIASTVGW